MPLSQQVFDNLIHVGALLYLICFLFRNQILLRMFAVAGDFAYLLFYYGVAEQPLWNAIYWCSLNLIVNFFMIGLLIHDKRELRLDDNGLKLYRNLSSLTPGEFRKLVSAGQWKLATADTVLTTEGQALNQLYYVLEGDIDIQKAGRKIDVNPGIFIGEIAYLLQKPATATVTAKAGSTYIVWNHASLVKSFEKNEGLKHALGALLSSDLAMKVSRA